MVEGQPPEYQEWENGMKTFPKSHETTVVEEEEEEQEHLSELEDDVDKLFFDDRLYDSDEERKMERKRKREERIRSKKKKRVHLEAE